MTVSGGSGGQRRADLALPAAVPVAELLPEVAGLLGLLEAQTAHEPLRIAPVGGEPRCDDLGLAPPGVADGAVLVLAPATPEAPVRHDDVTEAVAAEVERSVTPWSSAAARRTTLTAAGALLAVGLVAIVRWPGQWSAVLAGLLAVGLGAVAAVADRRPDDRAAAIVGTWCAAAHAAVAGALLAPPGAPVLAAAGAGLAVGGLGCVVVLTRSRLSALSPVLLGLTAGLVGLVVMAGAAASVVAPVALVTLVLGGNVAPRLALGTAGLDAGRRVAEPDAVADLALDVRTGHALLVAGEVAFGVAMVALTPVVVRTGTWGLALALAAAVVVVLRSRHRRDATQVQAAVTAGAAVVVVAAATVLAAQPSWRPVLALVVPVVGVAACAVTLVDTEPGARLRRVGDLLETVAVVSLLPLLVLAVGWFDAVRG